MSAAMTDEEFAKLAEDATNARLAYEGAMMANVSHDPVQSALNLANLEMNSARWAALSVLLTNAAKNRVQSEIAARSTP